MTSTDYNALDTLFLDVGNTLITMDFSWVADTFAKEGFHVEPHILRRAEAAARPVFSRTLKGCSTEARDTFALYLGTVLDCLSGQRHLDHDGKERLIRKVTPILKPKNQNKKLWSQVIEGVPEALSRLRAYGLSLVAVSNSNGTVDEILTQQGLRPYLTAVFDSFHVGVEKPDPRIFQHAVDHLKVDPARILHVGDLYDIDILGARAAGIKGILVDPFGDWSGVDCERIRDIGELCQKIMGDVP